MAGNYGQAEALAHRIKLAPREWVYIDSCERLLGLDGGVLILAGEWRRRKDGQECLMLAKQRRMRVLYDEG